MTGLTNSSMYFFTVHATNAEGDSLESLPSLPAVPAAAPATISEPPTDVTAEAGDTSAVVSWTAPLTDGGSAISSYTVTASPGPATATTADGITLSAIVAGLINGTEYTFTVHATNAQGNSPESLPSVSVIPVGSTFTALSPTRIWDSRVGPGPVGKIGEAASVDLTVAGVAGVPATRVTAVVLNVTAIDPTAGTFVTAWPAGETQPVSSNINIPAGDVRPNLVTVKVGVDGKVSFYNEAGTIDLVVDVAGSPSSVSVAFLPPESPPWSSTWPPSTPPPAPS